MYINYLKLYGIMIENISLYILQAQIKEILNVEPSLSSIEIVEKCFKLQNHSHVIAFRGGVKGERKLKRWNFL